MYGKVAENMNSPFSHRPSLMSRMRSPEQRALWRSKGFGLVLAHAFAHVHRLGMVPTDRSVRVATDIAYGDHPAQAFDVYLPREQSPGPRPFFVFTHGGGWITGHRRMSAVVGRMLAARGMAVVAPGYRLQPAVRLADQIEDMRTAIQRIVGAAADFGLDPQRYVVGGESAGAHLTFRLAQAFPAGTPRPLGIVGVYGFYDMHHVQGPMENRGVGVIINTLCRGRDVQSAAAEHTALRPMNLGDIPVLLLHGDRDRVAHVGQSHKLHRYLQAQGVDSELHTYPDSGHGFIYDGRPLPGPQGRAARQRLREFLDRCFRQAADADAPALSEPAA